MPDGEGEEGDGVLSQSGGAADGRHITTYGELDGISDNAGKARRRRDRQRRMQGRMLEGSPHSIILAVFLLIHCRAERRLRFPAATFFMVILDLR